MAAAIFEDGFNRPNGPVGNDWKFKNKSEGSAAAAWSIAGARAIEDTNITTLMYRANPVAVGASHAVKGHFVGKNAAELIFRYSATGGAGNYRWSVVVVGVNGKLVRRQWDGTQTVEALVASWTRVDDLDFHLHALITPTTIAIYDTNFTGTVDGLCAEVVSDIYNNATGAGVGSGHLEHFRIEDVETYTPTVLSASPIRMEGYASAHVTFADADANPGEESIQHYARVTTDPYVVVDGFPVDGTSHYGEGSGLTIAGTLVDDTGQPISAAAVNAGADYRWLAEDYANGATWLPRTQGTPAMQWDVPTSLSVDPKANATYTYQSSFGALRRPAVTFNGKGYMKLTGYAPPDGTYRDLTIAVCAVLHGGEGPDYSVFQTDRSSYAPNPDQTQALSLQYAHGSFAISAGGPRGTYERKGVAMSPTIMVLSLNANMPDIAKRGYILIQDTRRYTRTFSLRKVEVFSPALFFGAKMSNVDEFTPLTAGDLDVFEICMWNRALHPHEMQRYVNKVAPLYGVAL